MDEVGLDRTVGESRGAREAGGRGLPPQFEIHPLYPISHLSLSNCDKLSVWVREG